ncbi:MAG TPA: AbrB/MazE/SpoVT family DNA-binding domain-containing protein [Thermoanaerobaculia bacterium]
MSKTKVSSKYQVVIPRGIRKSIGIRVGQEMEILAKGGLIILIPDRSILAMRGFARGIRTAGFR